MASTHHGVVYTKKWVVDLILDVAGYVPGTGISDKVIIEPSCGCGAFLTVIAGRLADDAIAVGKGWTSLVNAIRAYDIDSASIETARKAAVEALMTRGCPAIQARELCEQWIVHGDFILDDIPAADFIVGNPPYVRAVEIDRTKRSLYVKRLSSVTTGCDLYVSFFDRGLDTLKVGGTLCFICADRWLQNKYGTLLRSRMGTDCDLVSLVRMHGVDAFDDEVDAYPAVTTIRKGVAADHLKFVNCAPEFNEADATAVLDWLMDDELDLVGERFEAFEIDKPTGNHPDEVYDQGRMCTLPGWFRPTKNWDLLALDNGELVSAIELKSINSSFGNNANNRAEESIGSAFDAHTAFDENLLGSSSIPPVMGYVMIVHDCPDSRIVGRGVRSAHFPIDPDFEGASYLDRFLLLCDRLRRKSLYQAVWLVFANPEDGVAYEPSTLLSYDKFIANIVMALGVHRA